MPVATAPAEVGRAPSPVRLPERARPPLRVVEPPRRRRPRPSIRRTAIASIALVAGSLLTVAGADAYLTQGQVRLTRLQQQLGKELGRHHDLEAKVAQLSNPSAVVSAAQQHGLQAPGQVTDLPLATTATTGPAGSAVSPTPSTPSPSVQSAAPSAGPR